MQLKEYDQYTFIVDKEKQLFHCFGCGIGGDAITFKEEIKKK